MDKLNISILPAGAWGTALAIPLSDNGHSVKLYFLEEKEAQIFNLEKRNVSRLPEVSFKDFVSATSNLNDAISGSEILIIACDCSHLRDFFKKIKPSLKKNTNILCVSKGIEEETDLVMSQVFEQIEPSITSKLAVMSGPNFAIEVGKRLPTQTVIASKNKKLAKLLQKAFSNKNFKVFIQEDVLGVGLGGALKNVISIGVGIGDGLSMGENSRAALITRGLAEIIKIGVAMGGKKETFNGLSGMGDLILCSISGKSRNYQAGIEIGKGIDPGKLITSSQTIEGLHTVRAVIDLAKREKISLPIMEMVYKIVYQNLTPRDGFEQLMKLELQSEHGD